jgi:cytochrome c-type biogenesis protein CcmH/NrfG
VAQISELNLVYLFMRAGESPRITPIATSTSTIAPLSPSVSTAQSAPKVQNTRVRREPSRSEAPKIPPKERYLRRAQEYYERDNFNQAIAELREVLKIDPKESRAHCLLGLSYLKSNMLTMAKVHINTASELSPNDPTVLMAKRQLEKNTTNPGAKKADDKSSKSTFLGGLFGGKKK